MQPLTQLRRETRALLCLECGKCSTMCPLAQFGGFSAARIAALRDPEREIGRGAVSVGRCLTCSACEIRCPSGVRFTDFVLGVRPRIPPARRSPCPHGAALQAAARLAGEGPVMRRPDDWLAGGLRVAETGELALFVGCLPLFDELLGEELGLRTIEIARSAVRLLNRLGIEPVLIADERCCGHDLLWDGDRPSFEALARANCAAFEARGVKRILTTCAECCRTWRLDYPEVEPGYRPQVQHLAEFLAERVEKGELEPHSGDRPADVTYHDPCRLGRHLGVYEAPRRLLAAVPETELAEMEHSGADAVCCGSPGFIQCDAASRALQTQRLRSAAATGADKMLTACPKCLIHFTCAQREDRLRDRPEPAIEVEDLTVFAASVLARPAGGKGAARPQQEGAVP